MAKKKKTPVVSIKTKEEIDENSESATTKKKRRSRTYSFPDHGKFLEVLAHFNVKDKKGKVSSTGSMAQLSLALHKEFKSVKGQPLSGKREPTAGEIRKGFTALKRAYKKATEKSLTMVLPPETDWEKFDDWGE
jgi:hypothetical protein